MFFFNYILIENMSINHLIQLESDTITDQPVVIPFEFTSKESLPEGKTLSDSIIITPLTVRTYFRLKPLIMSIERKDYDLIKKKPDQVIPEADVEEIMFKYDKILFEIVCIGIHNKKGNMPTWFRDVLLDNCNWKDIYILLNAVLFRIGQQSFCKSITTLVSVSPMTEAELIAAQKNLESWTNQ